MNMPHPFMIPGVTPAPVQQGEVMLRVTRDVGIDEPFNWLGRAVKEGEILYKFTGGQYYVTHPRPVIIVSEHGSKVYPYCDFPADAVEPYEPEQQQQQ